MKSRLSQLIVTNFSQKKMTKNENHLTVPGVMQQTIGDRKITPNLVIFTHNF